MLVSGHTVHYDPEKNLMELDPHKFAISPSLSLVNQVGGAYHATSCRNLRSIVERGILPGTSIQDDRYARYDTGRLHSYYGVFAPWDQKEIWFCIPKDNDRRGFELIEKIMDERLEDEMVLEYQASPILREFRKMKTPARLMQLLCDMPSGPHNAEKEKLLSNLATAVDYHAEDARRLHYMKEAVIFMIKHTHPGDLVIDNAGSQVRMRLCPACYHLTPSCLSRCTTCWSLFIARGKFRRTETVREESPTDVPNVNIAQSMEAAAAAVLTAEPEEDDRLDAMTVAEPEMEVDVQGSDPEPEHADDIPYIEEYPEEINDNSNEERQAVLLPG